MIGAFGPIIPILFLLVFFAVVIIFANVIFAEHEASLNMTEMDNETRDDYNASTRMVQAGLGTFSAMGWLLVAAVIILSVYLLMRAV